MNPPPVRRPGTVVLPNGPVHGHVVEEEIDDFRPLLGCDETFDQATLHERLCELSESLHSGWIRVEFVRLAEIGDVGFVGDRANEGGNVPLHEETPRVGVGVYDLDEIVSGDDYLCGVVGPAFQHVHVFLLLVVVVEICGPSYLPAHSARSACRSTERRCLTRFFNCLHWSASTGESSRRYRNGPISRTAGATLITLFSKAARSNSASLRTALRLTSLYRPMTAARRSASSAPDTTQYSMGLSIPSSIRSARYSAMRARSVVVFILTSLS